MRLALFAFAAAAFAASPALAQQPAAAPSGPAEPRINQVIVYGEDPCPPSTDEEITVCARLPDDDRFRIPSNLRSNPNDPANQAWAGRALELQYVGRTGAESCSTVGPGGFTGCLTQVINEARQERNQDTQDSTPPPQ